jgi:hypothetical protein
MPAEREEFQLTEEIRRAENMSKPLNRSRSKRSTNERFRSPRASISIGNTSVSPARITRSPARTER